MQRKAKEGNERLHRTRRRFIKRVTLGVVATSSYSLVSLTHFACKDATTSSSTDATIGTGGQGYYDDGYYGRGYY